MKYGLPYKGSKNKLAENILSLFPKRKNLYDLFSGGGAITHCALLKNQFDHVVMNDINPMMTTLFLDAAQGKYKNETRWISSELFKTEKEKDPYIACVWSFGNNLKTYLYGPDLEPLKKAWHYAIFFDDYSEINKLLETDCSKLSLIKNRYIKYIESKKYVRNISDSLQSFTQLTRLQSLERLERLERLEILAASFENVNIYPDSIIYCDIPYENTDGYKNDFDFQTFYDWAEKQKEPVFISSYKMPEDRFECIASYEHRSTLSPTSNNAVTEKVFIPKHQIELYKAEMPQPSLFENMF